MTAIHPVSPLNQAMPKAQASAPIGIFDSGIGGLSVAIEIAEYLPNERILYYADTAHVPYGPRDDQNIRELTAAAIEWLYRQGCKVAVVACNTASAFSLDYLRDHYGEDFPIIGLVPALKPAVLNSQSKTVAVLATPATFRGQLIKDVMQRFAIPAQVQVLNVTNLDLVPFVEQGAQMSEACLSSLQQSLQPVVDQGADYLVLGCTHYPFLKPAIESIFGQKLTLIDSGIAVARQTSRILIKNELLFEQSLADTLQIACYVSGNNAEQLKPVLQHLIPGNISWSIANVSTVD
ncbi:MULTISPECIES: glutamate racemase [Acinetobacter]|jgi:glutamate racemase|uniref:Glutamate racemase n=1 Tax=Acinetobacter towneri TaxID=202956 RepID=A0AAP9GWN8_9GAMM|nr:MULTISPECIES: glutamate racemase [Acinetobacter]GIT83697.1 glutamate racemase [Acinetobacter seohaensis]ENV68742.1 glutamate racemase [Acinetobacter towneri DSM 14962 = CIP 107472]MBF4521877.1 glutamate racemase [Acinetobacter towneri]MBT0886622.1 glutamate racemase [Acinetobacter towneri]MCA4779438.1 glutamate racemase [Acinetobacter towneri]